MLFWQSFILVISYLIVVSGNICDFYNLKIEVFRSGGFRVSIDDIPGISLFAFHANINRRINCFNNGIIHGEQKTPINGKWTIDFNNKLKIGDIIYFWAFKYENHLGCRTHLTEIVTKFEDPLNCDFSHTLFNGRKNVCSKELIFSDYFNGPSIDTSKWVVEQRIPTYLGPVYEFNSYENQINTIFFKNGKLFLKPVAAYYKSDVLGVLDLRQGCTSNNVNECRYVQSSTFYLPPVKSARIRSKFSFKYGNVKIRAKLPSGDWIFPVMQLQPKGETHANSTAIWIAYSRGNHHLIGRAGDDIGSTLLFAGPVLHPREHLRSSNLVSKRAETPYSDKFHVYEVNWSPERMTFYIDSVLYGDVVPKIPFDEELELSLGVGIGGFNDFPDYYVSNGNRKPWINEERNCVKKFFEARDTWLKSWNDNDTVMKIDYVKVFAI